MFFNPLWALLTIVFGAMLVVGARSARCWQVALPGAAGFAVIAVVVFVTRTFDYVRDDGQVQVVSTASNTALWGAFAVAGALSARREASTIVASRISDRPLRTR